MLGEINDRPVAEAGFLAKARRLSDNPTPADHGRNGLTALPFDAPATTAIIVARWWKELVDEGGGDFAAVEWPKP